MDLKGKETRFYNYKKTSGRINIPSAIVEMLDWTHNDKLIMTIEKINGQKGLFLFKKEEPSTSRERESNHPPKVY